MNLVDLLSRPTKRAQLLRGGQPLEPKPERRVIGGTEVRGFPFATGDAIQLRRPWTLYPWADLSGQSGWSAWVPQQARGATLELRYLRGGQERAREQIRLQPGALTELHFLPPLDLGAGPGEIDLELAFAEGCDDAFLSVHRVLSREPLYELCRGDGVEIGPGPRPQIRADEHTRVLYVEQKTRDEWFSLYTSRAPDLDESVWSLYRTGEAHALPVADGSCDFVFSSHVFEHLTNPIGHLEHWLGKLRPGGRIVAVVPDMGATKDRVLIPSTREQWLLEYEQAQFEPAVEHYARSVGKYGPSYSPQEAWAQKQSVHFHFYLPRTMASLLRLAASRLPIASWMLQATPNHKDFHFVVTRA